MTEPKSLEALAAAAWKLSLETEDYTPGNMRIALQQLATDLRANLSARPASDLERRLRGAAEQLHIPDNGGWPTLVEVRALLLEGADALAMLTDPGEHPSEPDERTLRFQATFWREQCQSAETKLTLLGPLVEQRDAFATRIADLERELAHWKACHTAIVRADDHLKQRAEARLVAVVKLCDDFDWQQDYAFERFREQLKQALAAPAQESK